MNDNNSKDEMNKAGDFESQIKDVNSQGPTGKLPQEMDEEAKRAMEKTRTELEKLKKEFIKKYSFIRAIGILPPQGTHRFAEEEFQNKEDVERVSKMINLAVIIPEDKYKKVKEIREGLVKIASDQKQKVWIHVMSHVDVFNYGLDGKYEYAADIGMSYPLYDKDFLASLRVAEYHKHLVLRKFERYVVSYVIAGSFVRGDTVKGSDVDTYVIIDDTDVKRMSRLELKEKLRGWIYRYIAEAGDLAQVKNLLNVQVYLLTEFWESVKDSHPLMFTFIRDGIPLYDRGTFLPWKLLLKMGKLKPSPEAIDMFMASGDKLNDIVKRRLLDIAIGDIYWSILTPSQALIMLYGEAPPTTKETPLKMKEIFFDKEGMLEKKYIDFVTKIIKLYKDYEHQKVDSVSGKEVDELMKQANDYLKRLKELRGQIEKRAQNKTLTQVYEEVAKLLRTIIGEFPDSKLVTLFEKDIVKKGLMNPRYLTTLKEVIKTRDKKAKPLGKQETEDLRKDASTLIRDLVEYKQREELSKIEKGRFRLRIANGEMFDLVITEGASFLISPTWIKKITDKAVDSNEKELSEALAKKANAPKKDERLNPKIFHTIEKTIGNFDVLI
jgi:predicted nucleotidyltransferase/uncharacterized protein (UPF0332 family)